MADSPPVETVVERAYFHVNNGGLTLSIVEVTRDGGGAEYRFKHELSMFSQKSESSFPLGTSDIVSWMNMALQRVSMKVAAAGHQGAYQPYDPANVTHMNGMEVETLASALRVAARFQRQAFEFPSPKALNEYLHEHPQADKSKHHVEQPGHDHKPEAKPPSEHGEGHGEHKPEAPKKSWGERLKSLGEKAKAFVQNAPGEVKKFVQDDAHRRQVLHTMHKAVEALPDKVYENAKHAVKHQIHEFKEAKEGIHAVLKGEKMSKEQKHAVKLVAFDVALTVATAAITGGFGTGLKGVALKSVEAFAKGLAKKIALNTVTHGLGNVTTLEELTHFGHGVHHTLEHFLTAADKGKKGDDQDLITAYITKLVADELDNLDPDTLAEAIEEAASAKD